MSGKNHSPDIHSLNPYIYLYIIFLFLMPAQVEVCLISPCIL